MNGLRKAMDYLDKHNNPEHRVIYQVMDLITIKYKGIESNAMDEEIINCVDNLILDWMWLYSSGLNLSKDPMSSMDADKKERYNAMMARFGKFQEFMRHNMSLVS